LLAPQGRGRRRPTGHAPATHGRRRRRLLGRDRLARQRGFHHGQVGRLDDDRVRGDGRPGARGGQLDDVARHQVGGRDLGQRAAVPDDDGPGRRQRGQRGERGLRARLLRHAQPDVGDRDGGDDAAVHPLLHREAGGGGADEQDHQKVGDVAVCVCVRE